MSHNRAFGRYKQQMPQGASHQHKDEFKRIKVFQNYAGLQTHDGSSSYKITQRYDCLLSPSFRNPIGTVDIIPEKVTQIDELVKNLKDISIPPYEEMTNSLFKFNFLEKRMGDMEQKMDFLMEKMERKPEIDQLLFMEYNNKLENDKFTELFEKRRKLPAFEKRNQILRAIEQNRVILLSGDTGCGKTTQVPQFILDDHIASYKGSTCKIICTQPRRISAISVAKRVSEERDEALGSSCGYQVRLEKCLPRKHGSIMYVTNGIIIRHMESDPSLNNLSHLIIDEIHERDIHSDFLLALVKQLVYKRSDLKVILMSATLNEKRFSEYFEDCPHIRINGSTFPVDQYFLEDVVEMLNFRYSLTNNNYKETSQANMMPFIEKVVPYVKGLQSQNLFASFVCSQLMMPFSEVLNLDLIFKLTLHICDNEEEGAILIFVTGYDDIRKLYDLFSQRLNIDEYIIIALHSMIPIEEQKMVFEPAPPGMRKIVISTNISETSITIEDVVFVIDSGWAKVKKYDARTKTENLEAEFISRANALQRKGRAGRVRAGKCYHLYTKARFQALREFQKPEVRRIRLESLMLQMKLLQLGKVKIFFDKLLDRPQSHIIEFSLALLNQLGALDEEESLTPLGYYLAKLPINPQLGKMLLFGVFFKCLDPILNVAVGLDYKSPFNLNLRNKQGDEKLIEFSEGVQSDHLLLHKALFLYETVEKANRPYFCQSCNLNFETMEMLKKLKREFMEHLMSLQLVQNENSKSKEWNIYSKNLNLIKAIVCAGLYPNIILAYPSTPRTMFQTVDGKKVCLHKKSILASNGFFSCPILAYYIKLKTSLDMVHDVTVCSPYSIIFFGDSFRVDKTHTCNYINVGGLRFSSQRNVSAIIEAVRNRLEQFILYRMLNPTLTFVENEEEETFLRVVVDLLSSPEK